MEDARDLDEDETKWTSEQIKSVIRCLHKKWYADDFDLTDPIHFLFIHRHLSGLFNYAGITESLYSNNPEQISPTKLESIIKSSEQRK